MNTESTFSISHYKTIDVLNAEHKVYLVRDKANGHIFVRKLLDVYNLEVYRALLEHPIPGIPKILGFCEEGDQLLLIEEYISGKTLEELIREGKLREADILSCLFDVCRILEDLHGMQPPIIHRDIKPSNIIISHYNRALLLDFNAAKLFSANAASDTVLLGTQGYAAPEQYGFASSSPQTDLYSLGVVLKEMLSVCPLHSAALEEIAAVCTQMDPDRRYSSAAELRKILEGLMSENGMIGAAGFPAFPSDFAVFGTVSSTVSAPSATSSDLTSAVSRRKFLPPGFRSGCVWKMVLASVCYFLACFFALTLSSKADLGNALWLERFFFFACEMSIILLCCNYLDVQRFFPFAGHQKRVLRYLGIGLSCFFILFLILLLLYVIEAGFFSMG